MRNVHRLCGDRERASQAPARQGVPTVKEMVRSRCSLGMSPPFPLGYPNGRPVTHLGSWRGPHPAMLGHDDIADNHKTVALTGLFENREKAVAAARAAQKRPALVACDEFFLKYRGQSFADERNAF